MTVDLGSLGLRTTGRAAAPLTATALREIEEGDLPLLDEPRPMGQSQTVKKLRERHHALARALAGGMTPGEAAILCGLDPSRVSVLTSDPSFKELLLFYRQSVNERYFDMHQKLADLGEHAVDLLAERLETAPDDVTFNQLLEVGKFAADRSGYGPSSSTQVDVRVGLADKLEAARLRTQELRMKNITPKEE